MSRGGRWRRGGGRRRRRGHIQRFLEPCLLLLLHMGRSHGYELAQELAPFGLGEIDSSLVYRMLREMEARGWVRSEWDPQVVAGPARRVYRLTSEGDQHLADWIEDLHETDDLLSYFLRTYDTHMREGSGEHH